MMNSKTNLTNIDDEEYDINDCTIELWEQDMYNDIYDVMVFKK